MVNSVHVIQKKKYASELTTSSLFTKQKLLTLTEVGLNMGRGLLATSHVGEVSNPALENAAALHQKEVGRNVPVPPLRVDRAMIMFAM